MDGVICYNCIHKFNCSQFGCPVIGCGYFDEQDIDYDVKFERWWNDGKPLWIL